MRAHRPRTWIIAVSLGLAGLIHLLPLPGLLGAAQLQSLYGPLMLDASSELLLRHRAWMFALVGGLVWLAIPVRTLRWVAVGLTLLSDLGFLALSWSGALAPALQRVLYFDLASIVLLLIAAICLYVESRAK